LGWGGTSSTELSDEIYGASFRALTGYPPYEYQKRVAGHLFEGRNIVVRAPTGAGKTWAVLAPFFCDTWRARPARLIYALPLRTLANGIYREACGAAAKLGKPLSPVIERRREVVSPFVTLQTGEQPDDPFYDRGRIIVTTYDQVLSGLLCGPYGLSDRLHNVNAAAIAGALIVFDEFHLMPPTRAFLTAISGLRLFRDVCQSVWMTATATAPLVELLRSTLDAVCVPDGDAAMRAMLNSLPSVTSVRRSLAAEPTPLTAETVLDRHELRSIAIVNTVGRAQSLFEELRTMLAGRTDVQLIMLHSRFFKDDRHHLEERLQRLFGKLTSASAILVATQVVEAGIDISCEHLHTELCPMNSLAQRSGRCARFSNESGTVHVYPLPDTPLAWLPYGDLAHEDSSLKATRELLGQRHEPDLDPFVIAQWVEQVHGSVDQQATRAGTRPRLKEVKESIYRNTIQREPASIAHLIRGDDSESIRVVIADETSLPASPGQVESISLSRWSLAPHLQNRASLGWYWSPDAEPPWQPLQHRAHLAATYAVCLTPDFAGYSAELGLRPGQSGLPSPARTESPRPGYPPLREELWVNHARMVADEAEARLGRDGSTTGALVVGFKQRYGLDADHMAALARSCGLLHDLGKLQRRWQQWAERYQQQKDNSYVMPAALAHTDFDYDSAADRQRSRSIGVTRPPHAAASAFYGIMALNRMLADIPATCRAEAASACAAAILAHHGSFVPKTPGLDLGILPLVDDWSADLSQLDANGADADTFGRLALWSDKRGLLEQFVSRTTSLDSLERWWPLVAYLMRMLRLADQRATSEWSCRE
jgi:CRISPR-associated endonuclease/helicase Cas3